MKSYLKKLEEQIRLRADKIALCDYGGESYTYAQVAEQVEKFHIFFQAAGIRKGDKIALCAQNSARWAIAFLAVNTYEGVIVPILPNYTPEGLAQLIQHSDSIFLIADAPIWKSLREYELPLLRGVLDAREYKLLACMDERLQTAWEDRDKLFEECYPEGVGVDDIHYPYNPDAVGIINYTSGTSGDPKGVMLRYGSMSDIVEYCQQHIHNAPVNLVSMLPMAHIYGLAIEFIYPCCTGFSIHFLGKAPSPSLLIQAMNEVKPYLMITVPLIMEKIYANLIRPQLNTRSAKAISTIPGLRSSFYRSVGKKLLATLGGNLHTIIIGGAPLSWKVESVLKKIELPYAVGYGMTEACPLLAFDMPDGYAPGSCGKPIHEIRIDSSEPDRIPGEIQAKGPNLFVGYYKNPEAEKQAYTADGWFRTGDLGIMDEGGNLFIRGRIKALILSSSGQNIYPEEVEQVLARHPLVEESLVVDRDNKLVALVYPKADSVKGDDEEAVAALSEDIRKKSNDLLPKFSQIFQVELVDMPFERTAKGSIKRHLYQ